MAQYKDGTVNVTNGSAIVTTDTGAFITNGITAGCIFTIVDDHVWYQVASIQSETQLTLSSNYAGTTQTGASYTITKDFTPHYNIPVPNKGDIETASLLNRSLQVVDGVLYAYTANGLTIGTTALATNATSGFLWLPSCAGAPTGSPTAPYTNAAACVIDTTNRRLYVRVGTTWRYVALT